ncbi:MAG: glycoside hydrolase family 31 protein [Planctomycetes bacterium]|nr:glycoside hydrolase family 31 protein [Planctomycetota bacterium]
MAKTSNLTRGWTTFGSLANVARRDDCVVVDGGAGMALWLDFPTAGVVRVRLALDGKPLAGASGVVRERTDGLRGAVEERRGRITVRAPGIEVGVRPEDGGLVFRDGEGREFLDEVPGGGHAVSLPRVRLIRPRAPGERVYGLGEKAWSTERSGRAWRLWNTDCHHYHRGTDPLYKSVPFLLLNRPAPGLFAEGRRYYGVFFDNPFAARVDLKSREIWTFEAEGGPLEYHVIAGPAPATVLERYTALVGRMPLPPLWALGYHQSRWSYYPERRVRRLAEDFRERRVPCDAIHLDIDHMDGFRVFTWHKRRFPQPARLVRDLAKMGLRVVTIVDPGVKAERGPIASAGLSKGYFLKDRGGKVVQAKVWPGNAYLPDFTNRHARRWWGDLHAGLVKAGVSGIWIDMNEPAVFAEDRRTLPDDVRHAGAPGRRDHAGNHNLYASLMAEATYRGLLRLRPGVRPFVLSRAGFAGIQRHAAVWTGDNHSSWNDLELAIPMLLGLGLSGLAFAGADVGGFHGTPTAELFTRWVQAAALTPLCRAHTSCETPDQEPWSFGPAAEERVKKAIQLRYRLLPYLYTVFEECSRTGAPIMRPLWWEFPDDPRAPSIDNQFMVGDALLVAPVLKRSAQSRTVYFPEGGWHALDGRTLVVGPITRSVDAPMDRLPVYLRAGRIVPAREPGLHVADTAPETLELHVLAGPEGTAEGRLYEDDGEGLDHRRGQYRRTRLAARLAGGTLVVEAATEGLAASTPEVIRVRLYGVRERPVELEAPVVHEPGRWRAEVAC